MAKQWAICLFTLLLLQSCQSLRNIQPGVMQPELKIKQLSKLVAKRNLDFQQLKIKSNITLKEKKSTNKVDATIYVQKDEKVWANITKFGISGARALITTDSVKMFERLESTYVENDYDYFNQLLKVDFINFQSLQNLLFGNFYKAIETNQYKLNIEENQYQLIGKNNEQILKNKTKGSFTEEYYFDADFRLIKIFLTDPYRDSSLEVNYSDWVVFQNQDYPKIVKVLIKSKDEKELVVEYSKFADTEMNTPYKVPSGYKKRE